MADMMMWNASTAGLIFIIFWMQILVGLVWETKMKRHLQSDGLMLSLAYEN
jgi:hypothetical protein